MLSNLDHNKEKELLSVSFDKFLWMVNKERINTSLSMSDPHRLQHGLVTSSFFKFMYMRIIKKDDLCFAVIKLAQSRV